LNDAGDHIALARLAALIPPHSSGEAEHDHFAARILARCMPLVLTDRVLSLESRHAMASQYADAAMASFRNRPEMSSRFDHGQYIEFAPSGAEVHSQGRLSPLGGHVRRMKPAPCRGGAASSAILIQGAASAPGYERRPLRG
jgi:hypothetical protein